MPYVPVPKDLTKVKTKLAFNLTKRQLVCFSGAAAVGLPAYLFSPSGVFLYPRGDRQFGGCTFDDRADDALFLLRHV